MYVHLMGEEPCCAECADAGVAAPGLGMFASMNPAVQLVPEAQAAQREALDDFVGFASLLNLVLNFARR